MIPYAHSHNLESLMKKTIVAIALALMLPLQLLAALSGVVRTPYGLRARVDTTDITLQFITPHTIRVVKTPAGATLPLQSAALTAAPDSSVAFTYRAGETTASVASEGLRAVLDLRTGTLGFFDGRGRSLLREASPARFGECSDMGRTALSAEQTFSPLAGEAIYGLGNPANGVLSQRGTSRTLMPGNIEDGIPAVASVRGYGLYWDCFAPTLFADTESGMTFSSAPADAVDYYLMSGDGTLDGVVAQMRAISGDVPMMPLWTYGFWQSRERYKSQREITDVVAAYRNEGIPLDGIIQDWQYWGNNYLWNAMEFMNPEFPDPQRMVDDIHGMNAHTIISIWSSFGPQTKPYADLAARGLLFDISTWPQSGIAEQWPPRMDYPSGVRVYNAYDPEARDIYWKHLSRLHDLDFDGWWMDSTEPDHFDGNMDFDTGGGRSFRRMRGAYPLLTVGGVHDHQLAADSSRRVFILTRSGWFGQQRYGCNVWTGDVASTWQMLRNQIPAHLNFTMTGNPNVNSDIGGFFCSHYKQNGLPAAANPQFGELAVRWTQLGAFTPMMRSHGADSPREVYLFGPRGTPVRDAMESAIRLRYRLLPYTYATAREVTAGAGSFMRPLAMDFAADRATHNIADQFMYGRRLLVAPVLEARYTPEAVVKLDENTGWDAGAASAATTDSAALAVDFSATHGRSVYFPAGTDWYDFFTGTRYRGGRRAEVATGLDGIPLFARAGSIIPLAPEMQYVGEKPWTDLELRVFPGADGEFVLYEDAGDGYGYTRGELSEIPMTYNHRTRTLCIGARQGSYPGMPEKRNFTVRDATSGAVRTLEYTGSPIAVRL